MSYQSPNVRSSHQSLSPIHFVQISQTHGHIKIIYNVLDSQMYLKVFKNFSVPTEPVSQSSILSNKESHFGISCSLPYTHFSSTQSFFKDQCSSSSHRGSSLPTSQESTISLNQCSFSSHKVNYLPTS